MHPALKAALDRLAARIGKRAVDQVLISARRKRLVVVK